MALFDQLPTRIGHGLPDDYTVRVSYVDTLGKSHSEVMTVGYGHLREVGRITRHDLHDIRTLLEKIAREMKNWTVLGQAIKVMTPADVKQYHQDIEQYWSQRDAEAEVRDESDLPTSAEQGGEAH